MTYVQCAQCIAILKCSGMHAGERQTDGTWPEGTFNVLVDKRLKEMAKKLKADEKGEKEKEPEKKVRRVIHRCGQ